MLSGHAQMMFAREQRQSRRGRAGLLAILLVSGGCTVSVPRETHYWSPNGRMMEHRFKQLDPEARRTHRDDVLRVMGPPQYNTDDHTVVSYLWEIVPHAKQYPDWGNVDPPQGRRVASVRKFVVFDFDQRGSLKDYDVIHLDIGDSTPTRAIFDARVSAYRATAGAG